jgi:hypothetical protein
MQDLLLLAALDAVAAVAAMVLPRVAAVVVVVVVHVLVIDLLLCGHWSVFSENVAGRRRYYSRTHVAALDDGGARRCQDQQPAPLRRGPTHFHGGRAPWQRQRVDLSGAAPHQPGPRPPLREDLTICVHVRVIAVLNVILWF